MKITYYAHAAFLVEAGDGTRIIVDPYQSGAFGGALAYAPIGDAADVVVATHAHADHGATDTIPGRPAVYLEPRTVTAGAVTITGIPAFHDAARGAERGTITMLLLEDEGIRLLHSGDLGHELDDQTRSEIGRVDVLLVPVGGIFTIDAAGAARVAVSLGPRIVIPMHYKTPGTTFPLAEVDEFLALQQAVGRPGGPSLEVTASRLPAETTTIVLERSR